MFKAIGWVIKLTFFAALVLVLGNWLEFGGKTVSDQVRTHLSHAERSDVASRVKKWATNLTDEAREGAKKRPLKNHAPAAGNTGAQTQSMAPAASSDQPNATAEAHVEKLPSTERQKLRALIQELNGSFSTN